MKAQDLKTLCVLPEKLVEARGQTPLSEAARELGMSSQHLYRIESGGQRCPAHISVAGEQKFLAAV